VTIWSFHGSGNRSFIEVREKKYFGRISGV
jgi:hypothetical protein